MIDSLSGYQCVMQPGYVVVSQAPARICSVCGNGVIVTIWDRIRRTGGMAHCVFPKADRIEEATNYHANVAIRTVVRQLQQFNPHTRSFEAQLFGGGSLKGYRQHVAQKVIHVIKSVLKKLDIMVVSEDTGGTLGKKVIFDTYYGTTLVLKTAKIRKTDWAPDFLIKTEKVK